MSIICSLFYKVYRGILYFLFFHELNVDKISGLFYDWWIIMRISSLYAFLNALNILMFYYDKGIRDWWPVTMLYITIVLPQRYASLLCYIQCSCYWFWEKPIERIASNWTPFKKRVPD